MEVILNGESKNIPTATVLLGLIESEGVMGKVMAAAVNMQIVKKEDWGSKKLEEGDKVELLQFVGGG